MSLADWTLWPVEPIKSIVLVDIRGEPIDEPATSDRIASASEHRFGDSGGSFRHDGRRLGEALLGRS